MGNAWSIFQQIGNVLTILGHNKEMSEMSDIAQHNRKIAITNGKEVVNITKFDYGVPGIRHSPVFQNPIIMVDNIQPFYSGGNILVNGAGEWNGLYYVKYTFMENYNPSQPQRTVHEHNHKYHGGLICEKIEEPYLGSGISNTPQAFNPEFLTQFEYLLRLGGDYLKGSANSQNAWKYAVAFLVLVLVIAAI